LPVATQLERWVAGCGSCHSQAGFGLLYTGVPKRHKPSKLVHGNSFAVQVECFEELAEFIVSECKDSLRVEHLLLSFSAAAVVFQEEQTTVFSRGHRAAQGPSIGALA